MAADEQQDGAPGPMKTIRAFGADVPFYVVKFDKDGECLSPRTADDLVTALSTSAYSHVLLYSHGWNNDFPTAIALYDRFIDGVSHLAERHQVLPAGFAPVFVGVAWPSTALTFGSEGGPDLAAAEGEDAELLDALPPKRRARAALILGQDEVPVEDARQIAAWLADELAGDADAEVAATGPGADEILAGWVAAQQSADPGPPVDGFTEFTTAPAGDTAAVASDPQAAGWPALLDPRWIVRLGTVLIMKDRAGIVGANGVADLIGRLLRETDSKITLFGHSYGCKVVMTALATLSASQHLRRVDGVLLLQPAVSHLCFAEDLGEGVAGGFARTLALVGRPVLATHSNRDVPLTRLFHLVARRSLDAGELQMAGSPSRFAALGGFGASGCAPGTSIDVPLPPVGTWPPDPAPAVRVVSLDGSASIGGHGDVNRAETHWAALNLLR